MPETATVPIDDDLARDLAAYFTITTAVELPAAVRSMSSTTLRRRPRTLATRLFRPGIALAGAAAVVIAGVAVARTSLGPGGGTTSAPLSAAGGDGASKYAGGAAGAQSGLSAPQQTSAGGGAGVLITYPGVDAATVRAAMNIGLLAPEGHGGAAVSADRAITAAVTAVGTGSAAGPAVLAWVDVPGLPAPNTCLCWVVDVRLPAGGSASPDLRYAPPATRSALVLVDATTGAVFASLFGPGVP